MQTCRDAKFIDAQIDIVYSKVVTGAILKKSKICEVADRNPGKWG
jgi:hypothetical protein